MVDGECGGGTGNGGGGARAEKVSQLLSRASAGMREVLNSIQRGSAGRGRLAVD